MLDREDDGGHIVVVVRVGAVAATVVSELEVLLTSFPPSAGNMRVELGGRADSLLRWFTEKCPQPVQRFTETRESSGRAAATWARVSEHTLEVRWRP